MSKIKKAQTLCLAHSFLALACGIAIYWFNGESLLIFKPLKNLFGLSAPGLLHLESSIPGQILRFYGMDFLWSYALFMTLYALIGEQMDIQKIRWICIGLAASVELPQIFEKIPGTFDFGDIGVQILGIGIANWVIVKGVGGKTYAEK